MATDDLHFGRLACAWRVKDDYDPDWISQPWETPDDEASNDVGNGWACRIGRAILVEESSCAHVAYLYDTDADAIEAWPPFEQAYGQGEEA